MDHPALFEAVIVPHRSLSSRALRGVLAAILLLACVPLALVVWLRAWPVGGFTGVEVLLAVLLIRLHVRREPPTEMLVLTEAGLTIRRTDRRGQRAERTLPTAWLRAELVERPGRTPALLLRAGGEQTEVAAELGEVAKRDLAAALGEALERWRRPEFDNPQLRAG